MDCLFLGWFFFLREEGIDVGVKEGVLYILYVEKKAV